MVLKKRLAIGAAIAVLSIPAVSFAALETGALRVDINDAVQRLVNKYEARIAELEAENAKLKSDLAALKGTAATSSPVTAAPVVSSGSTAAKPVTETKSSATTATGASTGNADYDTLIKSTNAALPSILKENGLSETAQLGLFEFVNGQKAFFVSIDDGKNPAGVTAFKTKVLFTYDSSLKTTVSGVFDLNYDVQRYVTVFGANPYAAATRTRVKNPAYTGKLLEETAASASASPTGTAQSSTKTTTSNSQTPVTVSGEVTAKTVRAAYDKNKLADAIRLANTYLAQNPNDVEILTVRYRSLYITGKYAESLKDVAAIEAIQGSKFDCTIAKDAAFIAKSAKDTAAANKYAAIVTACKK